ncbi:MAG: flagellar hook-basal body complex protein [Pseudomonadota bacterium]
MTISSSLNAGVAGLNANASRLATISDNIANSGTVGYKVARTDFQSLVTSQGNGTYSAGGVRVTSTRLIDQPGALRSTSNSTDLAVQGRGFLPVMREAELGSTAPSMLLSTTGSFRTDKDGYLVTESDLVLMGWPALPDGSIPDFPRDTSDGLQPVQVTVNQSSSEPTTQMSLGITLPATFTDFLDPADPGNEGPVTLPIEYFDNLGTSQDLTLTFTPTTAAAAGDPGTNTWTMELSDSAQNGAVVGEYTLVFDDTRTNGGALASVTTVSGGAYDDATGLFSIDVAGGPIEIDIGAIGTGSGLTQLSDSFAPTSISKDGSPVGNLTSVEVDVNGFMTANFDNGINLVIYQIPLVDLPNANGLIAFDAQTYGTSTDSGSFFLWDAGDGATGEIASFALEESTTDVAGELTSLIQTQRAYSSNAKVIQTVDEMLQETTNIKR